MKKSYTPINCDFYDRLEAWATERTLLHIDYQHEEGHLQKTQAKILDLVTKEGAEFMILSNNLSIRLDYLLAINGIQVTLAC
ncbi:MAG: hypothetical protein NW226_19760 [Microscillaceae bacterium]|nr:hypothetical protein [Microscillaceae bacterium]